MSQPDVVFLCRSNRGKSRMAQALAAAQHADGWTVSSAGTHPAPPDDPPNAQSVEALAEVNAPVIAQRPRGLDPDELGAAERVVLIGSPSEDQWAALAGAGLEESAVTVWETIEPSHDGIEGLERMRLIRDDIAELVAALHVELTAPARLRDLEAGATLADVHTFADTLPAVRIEQMLGTWRGSGLPTGHPLDGLLEAYGWYGKRFESADVVHPLLFEKGEESLVSINPRLVPLALVTRLGDVAQHPALIALAGRLKPLLGTRRPTARLRMTTHRGLSTATMCYDALPIHDVFRRVDDHTLLGLMDWRGSDDEFPFVLRRVDD